MVAGTKQILGIALGVIGFLGTIVVCGLPTWKVTVFVGANIVTAQIIWDGLWMNCVIESTGQMQCTVYESVMAISPDLQAARALVTISIVMAFFGILLGMLGGKCTNFIPDETQKSKVAITAGVAFILAGVLVLIPVCWTANTIIQDFYNPTLIQAQKREMGASLYIGWGCAALLILAGGLLCSSCPPKEQDYNNYDVKYSKPNSTVSKAYV